MTNPRIAMFLAAVGGLAALKAAEDFPRPYAPPCTERENGFEFTEKPAVKLEGEDRYRIGFAVRAACDVAVSIVDEQGKVVRHLGAGVLGANAPLPFQKNALKQEIFWNGKDDFGAYVKEPRKLRALVQLGLKPEFDKRLGGTDGRNLPGYVFGIVLGEEGAYVFSKGHGAHGMVNIRKFSRDGAYQAALTPPPANLPLEKLGGMGYVEYEAGVRALHSPMLHETFARNGFILPGVNGKGVASCKPALLNGRLYFCNGGAGLLTGHAAVSRLYYVNSDGSTEVSGLKGFPLYQGEHFNPRLVASPDGKYLYMTGLNSAPLVIRRSPDDKEPAKPFLGTGKPGSDNQGFNNPTDIACDAQGRLYVADQLNSRIQIFSPQGQYLKTIPCERATVLGVHQKSGALYVAHAGRVEGKTVDRLTKFKSFDQPVEEFHMDNYPAALLAIDSWSEKPRLWLAGSGFSSDTSGASGKGPGVTIWQDEGRAFRRLMDFDEEAKKEAGEQYIGRFSGVGATGGDKAVCDQIRDRLYYHGQIFDLKSGKIVGKAQLPFSTDDIIFDKRGYMHCHFNPGFYIPGVGRLDPSRTATGKAGHPEVPYDYGLEATGPWKQDWQGILPVKDQPGAKYFQDGIGVNMCGDVAVQSNIYYAPKMEDVGVALARAGIDEQLKEGRYYDGNQAARFERHIAELKRMGEEIYFIRRLPGQAPVGATVWTYDHTGELRDECAVVTGLLINGVQIDEEGRLYIVHNRTRVFGGKRFLAARTGTLGAPEEKANAGGGFTGTLIKTSGRTGKVITDDAPIPLDPPLARPPEISHHGEKGWFEGAEWFYAGAAPIVAGGCSCPKQLFHTDWYKRTFVPESYRHSIGIVDTAGNLIMHLGRYGNFDSGNGAQSKIPVGGDQIACFLPRFLTGNDEYLAFDDRGERLVVLRLKYHQAESVPIGER